MIILCVTHARVSVFSIVLPT